MLVEIFKQIGDELKESLSRSSTNAKKICVSIGNQKKKQKACNICIDLLRFGFDTAGKNYQSLPPTGKAAYAFSFYVMVNDSNSESAIALTEHICDHFDKKPFVQLKTGEREYELSLSIIETSINELNQFWMAQQQPHRPVIFYQARVSEI